MAFAVRMPKPGVMLSVGVLAAVAWSQSDIHFRFSVLDVHPEMCTRNV